MEPSTGTRGLKLSTAKKKFFPDLKSFIVSAFAVLLLLGFFALVTDYNNVRRLHRYSWEAESLREATYSVIEQRIGYAKALVRVIDHQIDTTAVEDALSRYSSEDPIDQVSQTYIALDEALAALQRVAVEDESYRLWSPYFDQIFILELELLEVSALYHERAEYFNNQKRGFPALLVAKRHNLEDLLLFDFGSALKGRP